MHRAIDRMLSKVDSRFTLVILASKRARQINDYLNSLKRQELTDVPGPQIHQVTQKPLTIAFEEIVEGKIAYERPPEVAKKYK